MIIENGMGRKFLVRVVRRGEGYGWNDEIVHDKSDPAIEFYDQTYVNRNDKRFGERGQFVARYYASTLAKHTPGTGLCLHGGVPDWIVDAPSMNVVLTLAIELAKEGT